MKPSTLAWRAALLTAVLASQLACSGYSPSGLKPGTSMADAVRVMGPSTGRHALVDGETRLEFARGPMGKHTYMLDFGADGKLLRSDQVLTEAQFNALPTGITQVDVLRTLGRPSDIMRLPRQQQTVWSYRYDAPFCIWFQVSLDRSDRVVERGYGPDPMCEVNTKVPGE